MKKTSLLFTLLSLGAALALSSCNTMSGLGEDIQQGGQALERTAQGR